MRRRTFIAASVTLMCVALLGGCGSKQGDVVVARVGSVEITEAQVMERLAELPPFAQQQFAGPEGTMEFIKRLVEEEVLYQAARQAGYEKSPEVVKTVEAIKRRSMIQAYFRDEIEAKTEVSEEAIAQYYAEHDEQFQQRARIKFRHIMTETQAAAQAARARVLGGEDFVSVAREVSTDPRTKGAGGLMSSVHLGDGLPDVGMDSAFVEKLFGWKVGEVTEPLRSTKGWHVVRIEEKQEAGKKPLDEVREDILQTLKPGVSRERYEATLEELKTRYKATVNEEAIKGKPRTEEELFTVAQQTADPMERLGLYAELVATYPEGEHADEAQFMIGFIQSEELKNHAAAKNAFERLLEKYPQSELIDSAKWMIENMGKEAPPFKEGEAAPATK